MPMTVTVDCLDRTRGIIQRIQAVLGLWPGSSWQSDFQSRSWRPVGSKLEVTYEAFHFCLELFIPGTTGVASQHPGGSFAVLLNLMLAPVGLEYR